MYVILYNLKLLQFLLRLFFQLFKIKSHYPKIFNRKSAQGQWDLRP